MYIYIYIYYIQRNIYNKKIYIYIYTSICIYIYIYRYIKTQNSNLIDQLWVSLWYKPPGDLVLILPVHVIIFDLCQACPFRSKMPSMSLHCPLMAGELSKKLTTFMLKSGGKKPGLPQWVCDFMFKPGCKCGFNPTMSNFSPPRLHPHPLATYEEHAQHKVPNTKTRTQIVRIVMKTWGLVNVVALNANLWGPQILASDHLAFGFDDN